TARWILSWIRRVAPTALLFALVAGTAIAANLWTIPAIGILIVAVCAMRSTRGSSLPAAEDAALPIVGGGELFLLSYLPFHSYEKAVSCAGTNPEEDGVARTTMTSGLLEFIAVWGILFAVMLAALWPLPKKDESERRRQNFELAVALGFATFAALVEKVPALVVLLFLGYLAARVAWTGLRDTHDSSEIYASFLLLLGLAMVTGCEFVHFKDSYGD